MSTFLAFPCKNYMFQGMYIATLYTPQTTNQYLTWLSLLLYDNMDSYMELPNRLTVMANHERFELVKPNSELKSGNSSVVKRRKNTK